MIPDVSRFLHNQSEEQVDYYFDEPSTKVSSVVKGHSVDDDYNDFDVGLNESVTSVVSKGIIGHSH